MQGDLKAASYLKSSYKDGRAEFVVDRVRRGSSNRLQLERVTVGVRENGPD